MLEAIGLRGERRVQLRVRMAVGAGPPRRDEVEDLRAAAVEQRRGLRPRDDDGIAFGPVLGIGMPDMALVAREHLRRFGFALSRLRVVVHAASRASLARSISGSMAGSEADVSGSSRGISAMI